MKMKQQRFKQSLSGFLRGKGVISAVDHRDSNTAGDVFLDLDDGQTLVFCVTICHAFLVAIVVVVVVVIIIIITIIHTTNTNTTIEHLLF
jgi:hypothetical protein